MTPPTTAVTTPRSGGCLCGKIQSTVSGQPDHPHTRSCRNAVPWPPQVPDTRDRPHS
ncbi:hypothetical protein [Streptomyces sp. NPDC001502]|uniref:hypothetical protein n=1 Tax=Streptomyces sp. NPDC001502 TaxID=3364578 RepID=UPI0036B85C1A